MNQISNSELDEITAFGFFNINLNLVISVSIIIIFRHIRIKNNN